MKRLLLAIAILALPRVTNASITATTAGHLKAACAETEKIESNQPGDATLSGMCVGLITGYAAAIDSGIDSYVAPGNYVYTLKFQENVTVAQMVRVYLIFVTNHPEDENKPAVSILATCLVESGLLESKIVGTLHPGTAK